MVFYSFHTFTHKSVTLARSDRYEARLRALASRWAGLEQGFGHTASVVAGLMGNGMAFIPKENHNSMFRFGINSRDTIRAILSRQGFIVTAFASLLAAACVLTFLIYRPAFQASWMFDDTPSLLGLEAVVDLSSAVSYVIGNNTGPTGRPLSMLSFLINVGDWDKNPNAFRQVNFVIHSFNITLVATIVWLLLRQLSFSRRFAFGMALTLSVLWGTHPLLASSVLSVVQRMTLLSGLFILLGLLFYLTGRQHAQTRPRSGGVIMLVSVGVFTLLAGFSKENGFLLPSYIGLTEVLILSRTRPLPIRHWRGVGLFLLWLPVLLFFGYVAFNWSYIGTQDYRRDFSWDERLWSQALILLDYVRQTFVPDVRLLGPFQDDPEKLTGFSLWSFLAACAWIMAIVVAFWKRKAYPILLFGLGWFLIGHLVESSFIQLELYFEHRNYIPMLGLLAILVFVAWSAKQRWPRVVLVGVYLPLMLVLLALTVRGWAEPEIGAERWAKAHPNSYRALVYQAKWVLHTMGASAAADLTLAAADRDSDNLEKAAFALATQCELQDPIFGPSLLRHIHKTLDRSRASIAFLVSLEHAMSKRLKGECVWLSLADLELVFVDVLENSQLARADPTAKARLLVNLGLIRMADGRVGEGLTSLVQGFRIHKTYFTYGLIMETMLAFNLEDDAQALTEEFIEYQPDNIFTKSEHRKRVLAAYEEAENVAQHER